MAIESVAESLDRVAAHFADGDLEEGGRLLASAKLAATTVKEFRAVAEQALRFGRLEVAREAFEAALSIDPNDLAMLLGASRLTKEHDPARVEHMAALAESLTSEDERAALDMQLGGIFEDMGEYDRSFAFYQSGNALYDRLRGQDQSHLDATTSRYGKRITPEVINRLLGGGRAGLGPIFIVGMPRSGSTLVEQILASHPQVLGGGETELIARIRSMAGAEIGSSALDDILLHASPGAMTAMADIFIETVRPALRQKSRLVDKQLNNFWNVGLIRLMFPDAAVIHCVRDPLDNCFSIYRRPFSKGGPRYAYDLAAIGREYRRHLTMMDLWENLLPGFVYKVRYETLVDDFEAETRRLVAHCGLEWDGRCLEFYRTERGVKTASVVQVRQPVYRDSIGIARHYEKHLGPLIDVLKE